jgi:CheY-like chemotaxis protein
MDCGFRYRGGTDSCMAEHAVILLAEDEEDYVLLIQRAFAQAKIPNPLHVVWNGQEAISYLKGDGKYSNREEYPLPDLFLLDLKMPRMNGFEVLKWVREQPGLAPLRVLVLTSSDQIRDVNEAYKLGANSFLVKPMDFQDFAQLSRLIQEFWLKACKTPETFRPPRNSKTPKGPGESADEGKEAI